MPRRPSPATNDAERPLTLRQQQGERSRQRILDVAMTLFSRKGYAGTSITDLSKACGLPASSIYWHFGSKQGLLWAVAERGAAEWIERAPRASDFEGDPVERLESMVRGLVDMVDELDDFLRLLMTLTLTERDGQDASQSVEQVRSIGLRTWREAMRAIFASQGDPEGRRVADALAELGRSAALGGFIDAQTGTGQIDRERYRMIMLSFCDLVRARAALWGDVAGDAAPNSAS